MRWSWRRDRSPAAPAATSGPVAGPSPMGWAFLPPLQRTLSTSIQPITRPTEFAHELPAWRNPSFNAPLTHLISDAAPSGVISGGDGTGVPGSTASPRSDLTLLPPPRPVAVLRSTPRAAPARFTTPTEAGLPVMQRSAAPEAPVDKAPAEEVAPAPETAELSSPDPIGTEVPVRPVMPTAEPATGPLAPSPISKTGPAMPLQRAVSADPPESPDAVLRGAGTRPRLGLGAPLTAVPPTAVSSPVQRTVDSSPRPLVRPETAKPVSRSVDHSPGLSGASASASAVPSAPPADVPTAGPARRDQPAAIAADISADSTAEPLEPTTAAAPVPLPLPLQRSAAASEVAPTMTSDPSAEGTAYDSSSPGHAEYDAPLVSAQPPLAASAAATAPDPGAGPSQVTPSTGAHPLVVARSAPAPGDTSAQVGRGDAAPSLAQDTAQVHDASPVDEVGAVSTPDGPGPGGFDHAGGGTIPDAPVAEHTQSPTGLPVVSRSVTALPEASALLRSTPLPLAAGLATSIQRGSVLLGAGPPATSLVVRPTPVLGARATGRAVPVQRVLTTPAGVPSQATSLSTTSLSTTSMPSTATRRAGPVPSTTSAAPPREPFLRRLQRGLFGPDQSSGPGAPSGGTGSAAGRPADSSASGADHPQGGTPTGFASSEAPATPPDDSWSGGSPTLTLTIPGMPSIPTGSRAVAMPALPGVPTVARSATAHLEPTAPLDPARSGGTAPSLALPPTVQRSEETPDTLDTAPLPHLALVAPAPSVVQRGNDTSAPSALDAAGPDEVQRSVDAGSWGSTEVSLSGPVVQTALERPVADPATGPTAAAPGAGTPQTPEEIEALAQKLLKPMLRRIKGELLLDRERQGLRTDTW